MESMTTQQVQPALANSSHIPARDCRSTGPVELYFFGKKSVVFGQHVEDVECDNSELEAVDEAVGTTKGPLNLETSKE
jgi:hypothetical protein